MAMSVSPDTRLDFCVSGYFMEPKESTTYCGAVVLRFRLPLVPGASGGGAGADGVGFAVPTSLRSQAVEARATSRAMVRWRFGRKYIRVKTSHGWPLESQAHPGAPADKRILSLKHKYKPSPSGTFHSRSNGKGCAEIDRLPEPYTPPAAATQV